MSVDYNMPKMDLHQNLNFARNLETEISKKGMYTIDNRRKQKSKAFDFTNKRISDSSAYGS